MKKLSNRNYTLHKIADFTGVVLLVGLLLFIWQLYRGSIALPFLKPYIVRALNHEDTDYQVTLDGVNLELVRSVQPLRIIASNVVYKKEGEITITAPRVALSFSLRALLRGIIAPSVIEVDRPQIFIFRRYGLADEKDSEEISRKKLEYYIDQAEDFWEHFNSEDNTYPESYINTGSLYLCTFGFLPLGLSATDPFWSEPFTPWTNLRAWNGEDVGADHAISQ